MDSLRRCLDEGLLLPLVPIVLDEWSIGIDSQDKDAGKATFIKVVTDIQNPGAAHARYGDIRFPPGTPRIVTSNDSVNAWASIIRSFPPFDADAIFKRVVFVEVAEDIMNPEAKKTYHQQVEEQGGDPIRQYTKELGCKALESLGEGWQEQLPAAELPYEAKEDDGHDQE